LNSEISSTSDLDSLPELPVDATSSSDTDKDIALSDAPKSKYETRFVGFVDLLGFTQIVLKTSEEAYRLTQLSEDRVMLLGQIVDALSIPQTDYAEEFYFLLGENIPTSPLIVSRTFSDCVMFSAEHSAHGLGLLLHSIFRLSRFMMLKGFYCRGAITIGEIFWQDKDGRHPIVFGPALNKAIILERKHADISRVIFCNTSAKKLEEYIKQSAQNKLSEILNSHTSQAKDGPWQVNLFVDFIDISDGEKAEKKDELNVLADKLKKVMLEYTEEPRVFRKLRAIAEQVNDVAKKIGIEERLIPLP